MNKRIQEQGFTLVELMVASLVFISAISGVASFLVSGISHQRESLATQTVIDQSSFFSEYVSRILRSAQKESGTGCLSLVGTRYELTHQNGATGDWEGIKFIEGGQCKEIYLSEGRVIETLYPSGETQFFTSQNVAITGLRFAVIGDVPGDNLQSRVTFVVDLQYQSQAQNKSPMTLQTTITQRNLDI